MDLKLIKEGEASILRKNLEKVNGHFCVSLIMTYKQVVQDHAAQITSLKATKEEADARQLQIQKEMRDEIERMKTQLLFKVALPNLVISLSQLFKATRNRELSSQSTIHSTRK